MLRARIMNQWLMVFTWGYSAYSDWSLRNVKSARQSFPCIGRLCCRGTDKWCVI